MLIFNCQEQVFVNLVAHESTASITAAASAAVLEGHYTLSLVDIVQLDR